MGVSRSHEQRSPEVAASFGAKDPLDSIPVAGSYLDAEFAFDDPPGSTWAAPQCAELLVACCRKSTTSGR
jgi:hypothetical protein